MSTEATVWIGAAAAVGGAIIGALIAVLGANKLKKLEYEDRIQKIKKAIKDEIKGSLTKLPVYEYFIEIAIDSANKGEFRKFEGTLIITTIYERHFSEIAFAYDPEERACVYHVCELLISIDARIKAYPDDVLKWIEMIEIEDSSERESFLIGRLNGLIDSVHKAQECVNHYLEGDIDACLRALGDPDKQD